LKGITRRADKDNMSKHSSVFLKGLISNLKHNKNSFNFNILNSFVNLQDITISISLSVIPAIIVGISASITRLDGYGNLNL
jgi:hypothetical protein